MMKLIFAILLLASVALADNAGVFRFNVDHESLWKEGSISYREYLDWRLRKIQLDSVKLTVTVGATVVGYVTKISTQKRLKQVEAMKPFVVSVLKDQLGVSSCWAFAWDAQREYWIKLDEMVERVRRQIGLATLPKPVWERRFSKTRWLLKDTE